MARTQSLQDATGVIATDETGDIVFFIHRGANAVNTDIADGTAGYAKGCIALDANGTDVTDTLYINHGTNTSANFDPLTG